MEIREITRPDAKTFDRIAEILTDSFWRTPLFSDYLFRGRRALAKTFLEALLVFSLRAGRVYVEQDGDTIWVGGSSVTCVSGEVLL